MITDIKCYKIKKKPLILGQKRYEKCDITEQLELPIYDTTVLDGTLDTTRISLLSKYKTPLRPLSRIIIETTDEINGIKSVEKIYRVVDNDVVTNIVKGKNPIYRHSVDLLEPTKILERRDIDNLSFTNYLPHNYGIECREVPFTYTYKGQSQHTAAKYYSHGLASIQYSEGSGRFIGPYIVASSVKPKTISTNVSLDIYASASTSFAGNLFGIRHKQQLTLKTFKVIDPSGNQTDLDLDGSSMFELNEPGEYVFKQHYSFVCTLIENESVDIVWKLKVVEKESSAVKVASIEDVVDRLLRVGVVLRENELPEFVLNDEIREQLSRIEAPEFSTSGTMFEALCQIGNFINAIPRLVPNIKKNIIVQDGEEIEIEDDYSTWNIVTFDFLGKQNRVFLEDNHSIVDLENPSESFATEFVCDVQNATISNYNGTFSYVEPYNDGFISPRTESGVFEISDKECIARTHDKIRSICAFVVKRFDTNEEIDITDRILEKNEYVLKKDFGEGLDYKTCYLYYETGEKNIRGLTYLKETETFLESFSIQEALKNIISNLSKEKTPYEGALKDLGFRIMYVPFLNFKVKQTKVFSDGRNEKSSLFYNQSETELDVERFGQGLRQALLRTGNIKKSTTMYYPSLEVMPKIGDGHQNGYCVFQINRELMPMVPVKASIYWSRYYNEMDANVGIQRAIRQFEISKTQSVQRNVYIPEYCIVDTVLDVEPLVNDGRLPKNIIEKLSNAAFATEDMLTALLHNLKSQGTTHDGISCAICKSVSINEKGNEQEHEFILPVCCFPFGASVVCYFSLDDNYSAATYSQNSSDYGDITGSYELENYITYSNIFGRSTTLRFELVDKIRAISAYIPPNYSTPKFLSEMQISKLLYKGDVYDSATGTKYTISPSWSFVKFSPGLNIEKDSRECLSVTAQIHFVTRKSNITVYKNFPANLSIVGNKNPSFKYVIFFSKQDAGSEVVSGANEEIKDFSVSFAYNKLYYYAVKVDFGTSPASGAGYGIITDKGELCLYVEKEIAEGQVLDPIYLMFRQKI